MKEKLIELTRKRQQLCQDLIEPARAAMNQMKDAGMKEGSAKLSEIIFQIDANNDEVHAMFTSDPAKALTTIMDLMMGKDK